MNEKIRQKMIRRLDHLRGVLSDCRGEDPDYWELIALYDSVRDIQPGLCEAIADQTEQPEWIDSYKDEILSDEEQIADGAFLWPEELRGK